MIQIKFEDQLFNLKNNISELTIGEFEKLCEILNKQENPTKQMTEIMVMLGIPQSIIDEMDINDFNDILKELDYDSSNTELLPSFEFNGKTYVNNPNGFKLSVRNNMLIEEAIDANPIKYMAEVMAILYLIDGEENTRETIQMFRDEMPATFVIPIIFYISKLKTNV